MDHHHDIIRSKNKPHVFNPPPLSHSLSSLSKTSKFDHISLNHQYHHPHNHHQYPRQHQQHADLRTLSSSPVLSTPNSSTPVLQMMHPPIPTFDLISHKPPSSSHYQTPFRPNVSPPSPPPPPLSNHLTMPLPNPGRAHRFCQSCDHVRFHFPILVPQLQIFTSFRASNLSKPLITVCTPLFFSRIVYPV